MTVIKVRETEDRASVTMQGLVHELVAMSSGSDLDPVMLVIRRGTDSSQCLMDQDDVDALHAFLSKYVTPLHLRERTGPESESYDQGRDIEYIHSTGD